MDELVSVIIPIYNVELYLKQCIESVIKQTYKKLEIILIDDGSTDNSGKICDNYKVKDNRIIVIHKKNGGLSSARNYGLDIMTGDYILFLDSDDYIANDYIETHIKYIKEYNADIVTGSPFYFWKNEPTYNITNNKPAVFSREEAIKQMLLDEKFGHDSAGPLYKSNLFSEIRFPLGKLYEDFATTYYVMANTNRLVYIDDKRYFYRTRPDSIMRSQITEKNLVLLDITDEITNYLYKKYPDLKDVILRKKIVTYFLMLKMILSVDKNAFEKEQVRIDRVLKENSFEFLKLKCVKVKDKIKMISYLLGKRVFIFTYKIKSYLKG